MHKIYFAGSISGGRDEATVYVDIIKYLAKYGRVLTEHIGDQAMTQMGESTRWLRFIGGIWSGYRSPM